ncbi:LytR/AlgR family response regulator transcription factor [Taibaiella koreensis]|uniref:LytR/AlgR family response regulator transcription factor n=1 Tax=Taibaiella koreensis TaxID=1268548 RepID=UPI000E59F5EA|nr:LytTR family DNA-binding domain-containing protein [Taibaiella koreensis]
MNTALILDDEALARMSLQGLLRKHCPQVGDIYCAATVAEAVSVLKEKTVGLLFIDIHLGSERGFGLVRSIDTEKQAVIFVTAHEQYALSAIKAHALDYLLKPVNIDELNAAVEKASRYLNKHYTGKEEIQRENSVHPGRSDYDAPGRLIIPHGAGFDIIDAQKIIFAEADGNYTIFHLEGYRKMVSSKQIGYYETVLEPSSFFRAHKSFIINLKYLTGYSSREGYVAHMMEGYKIPISRRKLPDFLERCKKRQP